MFQSFPPDARAGHRAARNGGSATRTPPRNPRAHLRRNAIFPPIVVALLGIGATAVTLASTTTPVPRTTTFLALISVAVGCAIVVFFAVLRSDSVASAWRRALEAQEAQRRQIDALRVSTDQAQSELQWLVDQVRHGEPPTFVAPPAVPVDTSDPITLLRDALNRAHYAAQVALVQASGVSPTAVPAAQVEVFVNLARRLQSLVHRAIQQLDDLERQVEDPDLLNGLFQVDHLATRIRRHAENLAVLGGADSRRQWTTPQALTEVLRSAIAEVEHYSRVKLVPPIEGTLHGHAVADVIHLLAELVENATTFSAPHTTVLLRAETVAAGFLIEVEDRGLGMRHEDQHRMNSLLADPQSTDLSALLRDGRLGLYVVSAIARRHGITVQLRSNIFGGVQALVVLPHGLLGASPLAHEPRLRATVQQVEASQHREPVAALVAHPMAQVESASPAIRDQTRPVIPAITYVIPSEAITPSVPDVQPSAATPSQPEPGASAPPPNRSTQTTRPALPKRVVQANLAPELQQPAAPRIQEAGADHDPDLMAAFRQGFGVAENGADDQVAGAADGMDRPS
jgi:signal transduction histidine kinase